MAKTRKRTESASAIDNGAPPPDTSLTAEPDDPRDRIAMRAYELYLARGGDDGGDFDDWLAAEREIAGANGHAGKGDAGE